jgi:hypothetical protein
MMNRLNSLRMVSRRMTDSAALTADRAVRSFNALRVFFWGFWTWRTVMSVC